MAHSRAPEAGSLSFDSPDGPVVVVRVGDNHAWQNFDAATMEPRALDPLPLVSAALAREGYHVEVCFTPPKNDSRLTVMFLDVDKSQENRSFLKELCSNLLLTASGLHARAAIADDWQTARAAWIAREADQRSSLRDAIPPVKQAIYDAWWLACRELCTLREGAHPDGAVIGGERARTRINNAAAAYVTGEPLLQRPARAQGKADAPPKAPKPPSAIPHAPLAAPSIASAGPTRVKRTQR